MANEFWLYIPDVNVTNKFLNECVHLFYLEYITNMKFSNRIRLFHKIWKILNNCQNRLRSKVPMCDVRVSMCVTGAGFICFLYITYREKYGEKILRNRPCYHQLVTTTKISLYLGANERLYKRLKYGCKETN